MIKWLGKDVAEGFLRRLEESPTRISNAVVAIYAGVKKIPGLNLPPLVLKLMSELPEMYDGMPKEQKQALFNALVAVGIKLAEDYAKGNGKVEF